MNVDRVMSPRPVTVHSGTAVRTALRELARHQITMLPVVDDHRRIVGVVAEGDLLESDDGASTVADVMRHLTVLVHPTTDLTEVSRILSRTGVKSLPVVDAADQVVGVVSRSDVVRVAARGDALLQQEIVDALCLAGLRGWRVDVHNGIADLAGAEGDEPERARAVAGGVFGIRAVRLR